LRVALRNAVADVAIKIKIGRGLVAEIVGCNDMHEYIVAHFDKVAEPHHWLWCPGRHLQRPLRSGP
jgi:hypothetical protein